MSTTNRAESNLNVGQPELPKKEDESTDILETITSLEKLYMKKETEIQEAQDASKDAQASLALREHDALVLLRKLASLQNRYLLAIIENQKKIIDAHPK